MADDDEQAKTIRLRYQGSCEVCGVVLPAGTRGWYNRARRRARCQTCPPPAEVVLHQIPEPSTPAPSAVSGEAGASARREYDRRLARHRAGVEAKVAADQAWRTQMRDRHPVLGRLTVAVTARPDTRTPQHVRAWASGSDGEVKLGRSLAAWASDQAGRYVLHDRRVPGTKANIDHLVVASSGVWVLDAKEYAGRVEHVNAGGFVCPDWKLKVGGRDRSKLATGVQWQQTEVGRALDSSTLAKHRPPVFGMLCFVEAAWGLFSRPFIFSGVTVAWPAAAMDLLSRPGQWGPDSTANIAEALAARFVPA